MPTTGEPISTHDPFHLSRFVDAQASVYGQALAEIRAGRKRTHWMWFIFPQIAGLGASDTAIFYAITSAEEARQYLAHPILGPRLIACSEAVLGVTERSASQIFGSPDDMKLRSSMTLFEAVAAPGSVFAQMLDTYYQGQRDSRTLAILVQMPSAESQ